MDFARYNRAKRAEEGAWLHVMDPDTYQPLYMHAEGKKVVSSTEESDKPCRILVQGIHSPRLRKMQKSHERKTAEMQMRLANVSKSARPSVLADIKDEEERYGLRLIEEAVIGWENLPWEGAPLEFTDENKAMLIPKPGQFDSPTEWLMEQISEFARERSNFFGNASCD